MHEVYAQDLLTGSFNNHSSIIINSNTIHNDHTQMMQRGNIAMDFDQEKISHEFVTTQNGGQIIITALDDDDLQTINQIKNHTRDIKNDFISGNFTRPLFIHAQVVPGTDHMSQNKEQIRYQIQDLKNGSILVLVTNNTELASSINQFMSFQSTEHRGH